MTIRAAGTTFGNIQERLAINRKTVIGYVPRRYIFSENSRGQALVATLWKRKRDIPMNDTIKKVLQMQKDKIAIFYGDIFVRKLSNNIFLGSSGSRAIASHTVSYSIDNVLAQLRQQGVKIERFTHHAFRDTFATRYIEEGGNMKTLQMILGHKSLSMTADLYAHVLPSMKQQEMKQIEGAFHEVAVL